MAWHAEGWRHSGNLAQGVAGGVDTYLAEGVAVGVDALQHQSLARHVRREVEDERREISHSTRALQGVLVAPAVAPACVLCRAR